MSIAFTAVVVRSERRVRLVFSNVLAAGAFNPALYVITSQDATAASPGVTQALVVPGANTNVELAIDTDLVIGGIYQIEADSVPAIDASVTPTPSRETFTYSAVLPNINVEPKVDDLDLLLFGRDIVWSGVDFLEDATGDLAEISGPANAKAAVTRRLISDGLRWDATYGAKPRQYVDGTTLVAGTLRGSLERQAILDDRVKSAQSTLSFKSGVDTDGYFETKITLVGNVTPLTVVTPLT